MSTNINANLLQNFIIKNIGKDLTANEAQKFGVEDEYNAAVEELDENIIDINDFTDDLIAEFSVLYVNEQENKTKAKDKEQEKEEQIAVKNKNGTGV